MVFGSPVVGCIVMVVGALMHSLVRRQRAVGRQVVPGVLLLRRMHLRRMEVLLWRMVMRMQLR